jgi:hypothetical protein
MSSSIGFPSIWQKEFAGYLRTSNGRKEIGGGAGG